MSISIKLNGDFSKTHKYLTGLQNVGKSDNLIKYAKLGLNRLQELTPKDTGLTAKSWKYSIQRTANRSIISWTNSNVKDGMNIALLIQYGHATGSGYFIEGIDYINPAIDPVFKEMLSDIEKEVSKR